MIARIQKSIEEKEEGFTLIELLVVMIIIGILAAIAIPVFLNQQKKANDTATKSDVSSIAKEVAAYYVDGKDPLTISQAGVGGDVTITDGTYSATQKVSDGTDLGTASSATDAQNWCVTAENTKGTPKPYEYSANGGLAEGSC